LDEPPTRTLTTQLKPVPLESAKTIAVSVTLTIDDPEIEVGVGLFPDGVKTTVTKDAEDPKNDPVILTWLEDENVTGHSFT